MQHLGWLAAAALAAAGDSLTVPGRDGWLFLRAELRHIGAGPFWGDAAASVSQATKPEWRDPLPAIVDYARRLEQAGIDLVVVPVPPKALVCAAMLPGDTAPSAATPTQRLDAVHAQFYRLLGEQGVTVVDLYPEFAASGREADGAMYCRTDSHWSPRACERAARRLAPIVRGKPWYAAVPRRDVATEERPVAVEGDLLRALEAGPKPVAETLPARFVGARLAGGLEPLEPDPRSPVVLLADSHGLVFHVGEDMYARGAGLADQLAAELGFAVDVVAVRGSGATPARVSFFRKAQADPAYLPSKKLVIWCFAAREFTESSGWSRNVPVRQP